MPGDRETSDLEDNRWRPVPSPALALAVGDAGFVPIMLVLFAVLFNAGLAIINAHITPISASVVIGMEVSIVVTANAIVLLHYRPQMLPWYGMILVIVLFSLERSLVVGQLNPKFLRDVLLIPTFVLLGMTTSPRRLTTLIVVLHFIVVGSVLFEACFTQAYSDIFDVRQYYIATRGAEDADFWNRSSDLFVSATRAGDRFFSFIDLHRTSSVFLEPVSLGNYVLIITAFLCANYRHLSLAVLTFLLVGNASALVGCDGRLAAVSSVICVLVTLVATRLPRQSALLYLPATLIGAILLVTLLQAKADDNFPGRVAYAMELLARFDFWEWIGNSDRLVGPVVDSGIAYTITTQSIFGLIAFWVFLVLNAAERTPEQIKYLHAICLYIALTLLVSYSLFSIKTAALAWFIHGSFQRVSFAGRAVRASCERQCSGIQRELGQRPI
jgi:putative polymerase